jgi:hypothetical protein
MLDMLALPAVFMAPASTLSRGLWAQRLIVAVERSMQANPVQIL